MTTTDTETVAVTTDIGPYGSVPVWLLKNDLDAAELRVYIALRSFADSYDASGSCFPSRQKVADRAGVSIATYKRAVAKLETRGVMTKTARTRPGHGFAGWTYKLPMVEPSPQVRSGGSPVEPAAPGSCTLTGPGGSRVEPSGGSRVEPPKDSFEVNQPPEPTTNPLISSNEEIISPRGRAHTRVGAGAREATPGQDGQLPLDGLPTPVEAVVPIHRKAEETFARFWAVYPLKKAKGDAWKAWPKAIKAADPDVILAGVARYVAELRATGAYTAYPATWLNGRRWEDEPAKAGNAGRPGSDRRGGGHQPYRDTEDESMFAQALV